MGTQKNLEYADVVWDNCTQQEANELEKIQNEAARIVTGATKLASIQSLMSDTGWESLTSRREKHKLVFFYKMINFWHLKTSPLLYHQLLII